MEVKDYLSSTSWKLIETLSIPPRPAVYYEVNDLSLSAASMMFLADF